MIWNYFKIAYRNLSSHSAYAMVNLGGLSIAVAAATIISLYSYQILTWDLHHEKTDQIYLVYKERITPDGTQATYDTWTPLGEKLKSTFPEVEEFARIYPVDGQVVKDNTYTDQVITCSDQSLFTLFDFDFLAGDQGRFDNLNSVIISESKSLQFFGTSDSRGEGLELFLQDEDTTVRFIVSGVFEDFQHNSSLRPEVIVQLASFPNYEQFENEWDASFMETWVLTSDQADLLKLQRQFPVIIDEIWGDRSSESTHFRLLPLAGYYNTMIGDKADAWMMLYIALGILIIAGINFMNLATARASYRSKEIGLRKVMGAVGGQIRLQLLFEALLFAFISVLVGLSLSFFTIPYINDFFSLNLNIAIIWSLPGALLILVISGLIGLFSGIYPAFYLSALSVIHVMRKKGMSGGNTAIRNLLIIVQFTVAVILISGTLLIRHQLLYMHDEDPGFDKNELLIIEAAPQMFTSEVAGIQQVTRFKEAIQRYQFVESAAASRNVPSDWSNSFTFVRPEGWTGDRLRMRYTFMDANFFDTYNIHLKSGEMFHPDGQGDQRTSVMLNEAAYKAFGFDSVSNPVIRIGDRRFNVTGVVDDFNYESLRLEIEPTLHFHRSMDHPVHQYISVRLNDSDLQESIATLERDWNSLESTSPFTYRFADEAMDNMYRSEQQFLGLVSFFTIISICIACLGLYGLTVFVIEKKRKEISIRKVVGAEVSEIVMLVFRDFAFWILIALIMGSTLAYFAFDGWLDNFHYRAPVNFLYFFITGLITYLLVLGTVGYHAIRAAVANPIVFLRED